MDSHLGGGVGDQQKNHERVNKANQRLFDDQQSNVGAVMPPPATFGARPGLNYSIQTGEEFALEFMRERVIPSKNVFPNPLGDPNFALEPSEPRPESSSMKSASQTSQRNESSREYTSLDSRASHRSLPKVKFLCSFGGTILPRPSDGKLRYVGGETRILSISKNISWQELLQKIQAIYDQGHVIRYQLPGEDLDALVSVSCDEDLKNMMEECNVLEEGATEKPRMFLFSFNELEDGHFDLGSVEGDSEAQYVVAVNSFDLGSRRNSINLSSALPTNSDELFSLNIGGESSQAPAGLPVASVPLAANSAPALRTRMLKQTIVDKSRTLDNDAVVTGLKPKQDASLHNTTETGEASPLPGLPEAVSAIPPSQVNESSQELAEGSKLSATVVGERNYGGSEADPADFRYTEASLVPPPVFRSERISREQAELNHLSKSNDFIDAQTWLKKPAESAEKLDEGSVASQVEPSPASLKQTYVNTNGLKEGNAPLSQHKRGVDGVGERSSGASIGFQPIVDPVEEWFSSVSSTVQPILDPSEPVYISALQGQGRDNDSASAYEKADVVVNIDEGFSDEFIYDMFTQAGIPQMLNDGTRQLQHDDSGMSLIMENRDPKSWSYFQNVALECRTKGFSLMDQIPHSLSLQIKGSGHGLYVDPSHLSSKSDLFPLPHLGTDEHFPEDNAAVISNASGSNTMVSHSDHGLVDPGVSKIVKPEVHLALQESESMPTTLDIPNSEIPVFDLSFGGLDISPLQIIKNKDLEELRELGSGTFGTVYHGKWRGTDVAIKRIKKSCFTGRSSEQERLATEFWREADILSKLHHPNVVAFYGAVKDGPGGTLATLTEFMVNGSLRNVLLSKDRKLDHHKRLIIAMDAAFGMEYLHSRSIVHFDLKCDNLLVNLKDPARPICKVADFGLSKMKRNTLVTGGVRGTLPWMAPELLNGGSNKVSEKVDVFSFGIVLWEILTSEEPYANMHYGAIIGGIVSNTLRPAVPSSCDPEWKRLMEHCWSPDPWSRPSFTEITKRLRTMSTSLKKKP